VLAWLKAPPNVQVRITPSGASWLNMIKAWFGILTRKSVRRESFASVKDLIRHIRRYNEHWNDHPTPFVWTTRPAHIIKKALRRGR
jgi:transposase